MSQGDGGATKVGLPPERKCPICGRKATREFYPLCSKRCADVDLNRWLSGAYAIAGAELDSEDEQEEG